MRICSGLLIAAAVLFGTAQSASAYPAAARVAVNMRAGPGVGYRVLMVVPRAGIVDVRTCQPAWCQVGFRGRVGYVSRTYLQVRPGTQTRPLPPPRPLPPAPPRDDYSYDPDPYDPYPPYNQPPYQPPYNQPPYQPPYNQPPYNPPQYDPGYGDPYGPPDYPDQQAYVCFDENTRWALGRAATRANVDRIRDDANARLVRIVRPGQVYTQEYSEERVNIEVDYRNVIIDIRCG